MRFETPAIEAITEPEYFQGQVSSMVSVWVMVFGSPHYSASDGDQQEHLATLCTVSSVCTTDKELEHNKKKQDQITLETWTK